MPPRTHALDRRPPADDTQVRKELLPSCMRLVREAARGLPRPTVLLVVLASTGCAPSDRPIREDAQSVRDTSASLLGKRTDSAVAHLVRRDWNLEEFTSHRQVLGRQDHAELVLYSRGGRVCYTHLVTNPDVGYDPERPDSLLVYMPKDRVKDAYTEWLGHLIGRHGMPLSANGDTATWGALRVTHGSEFLHGFVGHAEGCLEPSDPSQDVRDK